MYAADLTDIHFPQLKTSTLAVEAKTLFQDYRISHIPIVNNEDLLGLLSDDDLIGIKNDEPIGGIRLSLQNQYIKSNQHIFDVLQMMSEGKLSGLPVVDEKNRYIGCISAREIINEMGKILAVNNPGGIIILEVSVHDYMLSQISSIVEGNDAKILAVFTKTFPDSIMMHVILKINKTEISGILQTFSRYDYVISATFGENENEDLLRDRYDSLMKYLDI